MRAFLVILLIAWLLGLVLAVANMTWLPVILSAGGSMLLARIGRMTAPLILLTGVLVVLGFIRGDFVATTACTMPPTDMVYVVDSVKVEATRVQYVVEAPNACTILVFASRWPLLRAGTEVEILGGTRSSIADIQQENEGYASYVARRGLTGTWRYPSIEVVTKHRLAPGAAWLQDALVHTFAEPELSLVDAMLFARVGTIPANITEQFRVTGITHILAISGSNISIIAAALYIFIALLPLPTAIKTALVTGLLWFYIVLIGAPVSATRAGVFWTLVIFAARRQALVSLPTVVILAVVGMATFIPGILTDISFQLSVSAVIGIFMTLFLVRPYLQKVTHGKSLVLTAAMTLGATVICGPITIWHFGTFSFISILANILIVPVVPLFMASSALAIGAALVWLPLGLIFAWGTHVILEWMRLVTSVLSAIPGAYIAELYLPIWVLASYYAVILLCAIGWLAYQRRSWREVWA